MSLNLKRWFGHYARHGDQHGRSKTKTLVQIKAFLRAQRKLHFESPKRSAISSLRVRVLGKRVGGRITPAVLSHHRTCGSAYGGSLNMLETLLCIQQRNQPQRIKEAFWMRNVHMACSGVPPRATSVSCRFPCAHFIQTHCLQFPVPGRRPLPLPP